MDDIMIASAGMKEHLLILKEVFKRLVENQLELRIDKCELLQDKVKYLGFEISKDGIRAEGKGLDAVRNSS